MSEATPDPENTEQAESLEEQLEEGLEDSFPASDPPSVARRHRAPASRAAAPHLRCRRRGPIRRLDPGDRCSVGYSLI